MYRINMGNVKKIIFSDRRFVNSPGDDDTGYIQAEVSVQASYDKDNFGYVSYSLQFADCSRIINFNIEGSTKPERKNSIIKVTNMIEVLKGFKKALKKGFEIEDEIKAKKKAERKRLKAKKKAEAKKKEKAESKPE